MHTTKKQPVATEQLKVFRYVMQIVDQWIGFSKTRLHFKRNISSKNWYGVAEDPIYFQYSSVDKKRCRHNLASIGLTLRLISELTIERN